MTPPVCGFEFRGERCGEVGDHFCEPRGQKAVEFFPTFLTHPAGVMAGKPFVLEEWQDQHIVRPLFAEVMWTEYGGGDYIRRYINAWVEISRKNGKTTLVAGIMLYLLVADGEQSGQVIIAAKDREQASNLFNAAKAMVQANSKLLGMTKVVDSAKRILHPKSNSFLRVISRDADSALGTNPSAAALDEVVAQPNADLYNSLNTGMGARKQPLMFCITTAGNDPESFAAHKHREMEYVRDHPESSPRTLVYMANTPIEADWTHPDTWKIANPALGKYLSPDFYASQVEDAKKSPSKEIAFRTFHLNTWMNVASRWMPMHTYDAAAGEPWKRTDYGRVALEGRKAFAALDLSSTSDLTSWCLAVPGQGEDEPALHLLWRFWVSETGLDLLDSKTDNKFSEWAKAGWLQVSSSNVIDYDQVYDDIEQDLRDFEVVEVDYDPWGAEAVIQQLEKRADRHTQFVKVQQSYAQMSPNMTALMNSIEGQRLAHHGNPLARYCFDSVEVKYDNRNPDNFLPVKQKRADTASRIDGVITAAMAVGAYTLRGKEALAPKGPKGRRPGKRAFAFN